MRWAEPVWLWGVPGAACLGLLLRAAQTRALRMTRRLDPRFTGRGTWRVCVLPSLCLALIFLALARPQWGYRSVASVSPGTDSVLVFDTSGSMLTRDVSPDRFAREKVFVRELLRDLPENVRIGLVRVEGEGSVVSPLTLDREALKTSLDELVPRGTDTPGSDLGSGVRTATALLSARGSRSRAIVLLSDGEDLDDGLQEAVRDAVRRGIAFDTVCSGTAAGGPVPARGGGFLSDGSAGPVVSHAHPEKMRQIAADSGGVFLSSDS
ncbi:MAG: vWA domain-containing protein, partial [Thermoanaerobaculia bacterium]